MKQKERKQQTSVEYPLYNICYKTKDGEEKVISREVSLDSGIRAIRKFDHLLLSNRKVIKDVLYCYLLPLLEKRPAYDKETGLWSY